MKRKIGWILSGLVSAMLLFSASGKFATPNDEMIQGVQHLGLDLALIRPIGLIEAVITLLYLIPRTSFIGAILITGYMGGAIFAHVRVGDPFLIQILVPIVAWVGLGLRRYEEALGWVGLKS